MKRLTFKKPFNGMDSALKLIPESYKVDGKEFQITDGIESYNIRWDINEATVLIAENKNLINEDMNKIKHLMGFKSQDTLGTLKGQERLNENKSFTDVWNKTKDISEAGQAFGMGFTGEGNLEENEPIEEMERVEEEVYEAESGEEVNEFENKDVEKLFDTMGDMSKIQTLASKINTRPEKIEAAVAYAKAIVGDDKSLQKKVARILMNDKSDEQNVSPELAQQAADGNMNERSVTETSKLNENYGGEDELAIAFFKERFRRNPEHDPAYFETWKERLNSYNPTAQMDNESKEVWMRLKDSMSPQNDIEPSNGPVDRFDEIFEDMYKEELTDKQSEVMDTDGDGDIDAKDLANLRNKK
jgi:hypothetical protein